MSTYLNWTNQHVNPDFIISNFFKGCHGEPDIIEVLEGPRQALGEVLNKGEDPLHLHAIFLVTGFAIVELPCFGFCCQTKLQVLWKRAPQFYTMLFVIFIKHLLNFCYYKFISK